MESILKQWLMCSGWKPLTEEEEKDLAQKIRKHNRLLRTLETEHREAGMDEQKIIIEGKAAVDSLVEHMIPLAVKIAGKYAEKYPGCFLTYDDFQQEACLGIMHAAELYSPDKGARFSTYATLWIEQYIRRAIEDKGDLVRKPASAHSRIRMMRKCGDKASAEEISGKTGINVDEVKFLKKLQNICFLSLDRDDSDSKYSCSHSENLADPRDYREMAEEKILKEQFHEIIRSMKNERQRTVMEMHLGLTKNNTCFSNSQISRTLKMKPSEVIGVINRTQMELIRWGRPSIGLR